LKNPDKKRCTGTTASGEPCQLWANDGELCAHHNGTWISEERRCTATITGGTTRQEHRGERCKNPAMRGQKVCAKHGGRAPQNRRAAAVRLMEEEGRRILAAYGGSLDISATEALLNEVCRTAGHVEWLSQRVAELENNELIWGTTRVKEGGQDGGTTQEAEAHMWLKLYKEERAHLVRVCSEAIRCGIEERYVKLAESQGALIAEAVKAILCDLNLTPEQQKLAFNVVPMRLRQITAKRQDEAA